MDSRFRLSTLPAFIFYHDQPDSLSDPVKTGASIWNLIERFNCAVEAAFEVGNANAFESLCTTAGWALMQRKFDKWRTVHHITALNLVSCDFLTLDLNPTRPDLAHAFTCEKWIYHYENGSQTPPQASVDCYQLYFENAAWKVASVESYTREG
jgi:hypothetical protein